MEKSNLIGRLGGAALLAWALAAPLAAQAKGPGEVDVGEPLREASLHGLNGGSRPLSAFRGQPLIINVWASWCGPCRAEAASLERLAWSGSKEAVPIIGISTDDDPRKAQAWLKDSNATISHFIDRNLEMEHMLGADRLPLTVFIGADGRVLRKVYGAKQWDGPQARQLIAEVFRTGTAAAPAR